LGNIGVTEPSAIAKNGFWGYVGTIALLLSVFFVSARVYRYLVDAFMLAWVLREVFTWLQGILEGRASTYPPGWKPVRGVLVRTLQVVTALTLLIVCVIALRSIRNDISSTGWMPSESSANHLFVALIATGIFFSSITPRQWSMRDLGELAIGLGLILGLALFVPYVPEGSY
jgi:hypothetical protein